MIIQAISVTSLLMLATAIFFVLGLLGMRKVGFDQKNGQFRPGPLIPIVGSASNGALLVCSLLILVFIGHANPGQLGLVWNAMDREAALGLLAVLPLLSWPARITHSKGLAAARPGSDMGRQRVRSVQRTETTSENPVESEDASNNEYNGLLLLLTTATLAIAALQEEVIFRAGLWLEWKAISWILAVGLSSLLFTIVHLITTRPNRWKILSWGTGGLALMGIYVFSGSLWIATLAHFLRNITNLLFMKPVRGLSPFALEPISDRMHFVWGLSLSVAHVAICFFLYGPYVSF